MFRKKLVRKQVLLIEAESGQWFEPVFFLSFKKYLVFFERSTIGLYYFFNLKKSFLKHLTDNQRFSKSLGKLETFV